MREFIYSIPTEDRLAFEKRVQQDFSALWAPGHFYAGLRAILAIAFGALIFGAIPQIERALAVFAISLFLFWGIPVCPRENYFQILSEVFEESP